MRKTRIQVAKPQIIRYFNGLPERILRLPQIGEILAAKRGAWKLPASVSTAAFIRFLTDEATLTRHDFPFPYRSEHRYTWGDTPTLELLLQLKKNAYFSHHTAMWINNLCQPTTKLIYVNHEQRPHIQTSDGLEQHRIDAAFARAPRVSKNTAVYRDLKICLVNGMYTGQLGVITRHQSFNSERNAAVQVTSVERTLIDITVRPAYSGGTTEVLSAFANGKGQFLVSDLAAMLKKLNYTYPYHQAIGFYLERAGYKQSDISLFRNIPKPYDFYLSHKMAGTKYIREWKLHVPKDFP